MASKVISELREVEREQKEDEKLPNKCQTTCMMLKNGTCPHGLSGKKSYNGLESCVYYHPKICMKFSRHGAGPNECSAGDECGKLHKTLCPAAAETTECYDRTCKLLHIIGTKLSRAKNEAPSRKSDSDRRDGEVEKRATLENEEKTYRMESRR